MSTQKEGRADARTPAQVAGSAAQLEDEAVKALKGHVIEIAGELTLSGPDLLNQSKFIRDLNDKAYEFELKTQRSDKPESRTRLLFNFSQCNVTVQGQCLHDAVEYSSQGFLIATPDGESVELILSIDQAAELRSALEQYVQLYSAVHELQRPRVVPI